ncbi:hypothetical protein GCM10022239_11600 [Leifsonia bigeumensis]|uniref:Uncharacterized protein n=1 Tax=Leifsonella bigeumensis TaxID=433643 RepID=A0ABP7FEN9_9MICO
MTSKFAEALAVVNGRYQPTAAPPARSAPSYPEAYAKFEAAKREAVKFHDKNWNNSAITHERRRRLQMARAELRQVLDATSAQAGADPDAARRAAFEQIAATDANSVAVVSNEWGKVRALLDSGRNLGQIIDNADRRRLSAILDHLDSDLAVQTGDPEGVAAEVSQAVLVRLAGLGDEKAQQAMAAQEATEHSAAWREVIEQAGSGQVTLKARTALYQANVDEYRAAFNDDLEAAELDQAVANLDSLQVDAKEGADG